MQNNESMSLISKQRFSTYEKLFVQIVPSHAISEVERRVLFYMDIQGIYSHFFIPVQVLEVTLRNRIHNSISVYYGTNQWLAKLLKEKTCSTRTKDMFNTTKNSFDKKNARKGVPNKYMTPEDYVGALNFGFWVELMNKDYRTFKFWQIHINDVFPNKKNVKHKAIFHTLQRANKIRNRLYHYEPLWNTSKNFADIDKFCDAIEEQYSIIVNLIRDCSITQDDLIEDHKFYFKLAIEEFKTSYRA